MALNMFFLLIYMLQALTSQQKEGIGNLLAIGLLALLLVVLLVVGIRFKNKSQQREAQEIQEKNTPLKAPPEEPSKKAVM